MEKNEAEASLERLKGSMMDKADMLRSGIWEVNEEGGEAGELYDAITSVLMELENEAHARHLCENRLLELGQDPKVIYAQAALVAPSQRE